MERAILTKPTLDEEAEEFFTYTTKTKGGELTYSFYEEIINKKSGRDAAKKLPTLGKRESRLWFSMIYFAKKQGDGLEGSFTASELIRLWGEDPDKKGRLWEDIRKTFLSIVSVVYHFTNQKSKDERIDWGFRFTSGYQIEGKGKETRYFYTLSTAALGFTEKWLKGELSVRERKGRGVFAGEVRRNPSAFHFWQKVKKLKAEREKTTKPLTGKPL